MLIKKFPYQSQFLMKMQFTEKCGHRCDLCVHYTGISEEFRDILISHLNAVYGIFNWDMRCTGCDTLECYCCKEGSELCEPLKYISQKANDTCMEFKDYSCHKSTVGYKKLEHKNILADDVTYVWQLLTKWLLQLFMNLNRCISIQLKRLYYIVQLRILALLIKEILWV